MKILGVSAFYHDSSVCLIEDGKIIFACQEERLSRIKHDASFPINSIRQCLASCNLKPDDIEHIVFFEKPFLKFERLLETYLAFAPKGFKSFKEAMPLWLKEKLFQKKLLVSELEKIGFSSELCKRILFSEHHLSHTASAFFPSPFEEALILTMDGVGEWDTTTVYFGKNNTLKKIYELHFPHSLGLLYSAFTYYCGFKVNSGEYKLMGLAPYGKPKYADKIKKHLIDIKADGSFRLNLKYFDYCTGLTMTNKKFDALFGFNKRSSESALLQQHMDLAASIQLVIEEVILKICSYLQVQYKTEYLCLAGGVALNCVANGKIRSSQMFKDIWVQPAAGDAGGSLGAALAVYYTHLNNSRKTESRDSMLGSYLGPNYSDTQISEFFSSIGAVYTYYPEEKLLAFVANKIASGSVVGWFQGAMEFGPRALGNRSILADPRNKTMQKILNLKIKFRESFRPFAPAVLEEYVGDWFESDQISPYMLFTTNVKNKIHFSDKIDEQEKFGIDLLNQIRSELPAITHVDYSARVQTVSKKTNRIFYELIQSFHKITGVPVLINTSFNIRGEPIVCTPEDAFKCFMGTDMDILVIGNFLLEKSEQKQSLIMDYRKEFSLD